MIDPAAAARACGGVAARRFSRAPTRRCCPRLRPSRTPPSRRRSRRPAHDRMAARPRASTSGSAGAGRPGDLTQRRTPSPRRLLSAASVPARRSLCRSPHGRPGGRRDGRSRPDVVGGRRQPHFARVLGAQETRPLSHEAPRPSIVGAVPVGVHGRGATGTRPVVLRCRSSGRPVPCFLPWMSVRMKTIRSPFCPRSAPSRRVGQFSRNSSTQAASMCCTRTPAGRGRGGPDRHLARATMFSIIAPPLKSLKYRTSLVAVGVGHLEEAVPSLGVHPLDGARWIIPGTS